ARAPLVLLAAKGNRQTFRHKQIERQQARKAPALIAWSNEVVLFVHDRKRQGSAEVYYRRDDEFATQSEVSPEEQPVRHVDTSLAVFVGPDHCVLEIAEVGVAVVQISSCLRSDV